MPEPWGNKITLSIYFEGDSPNEDLLFKGIEMLATLFESYGLVVDFVGSKHEPVQEEPGDLNAT